MVQTGANLAIFQINIIYYMWLIQFFYKTGKRLCNGDLSFLSMPLVSSVKGQSKLPKSLLVGGQRSDRLMFCLKLFDFNDFSLKLIKYLMFPNSHFCLKI